MKVIYLILISIITHVMMDEPALKINLKPPEEDTKDTLEALNDIEKLEDDLRKGANDDFDDEKKKLIALQKSRVHDIVHGAFKALNALIPNPIKASIRQQMKDNLSGNKSSNTQISTEKAQKAVNNDPTNNDIRDQEAKIRSIDSRFREVNSISDYIKKRDTEQIESSTEKNDVKLYSSNIYSDYNTELNENFNFLSKPL